MLASPNMFEFLWCNYFLLIVLLEFSRNVDLQCSAGGWRSPDRAGRHTSLENSVSLFIIYRFINVSYGNAWVFINDRVNITTLRVQTFKFTCPWFKLERSIPGQREGQNKGGVTHLAFGLSLFTYFSINYRKLTNLVGKHSFTVEELP